MSGVNKAERFLSKVDTRGNCWVWQGTRSRGYGLMSTSHGKTPAKAHRVSYELFVGPIPAGMHVLHHCDNPPCVRPSHLFLGDAKVNAQDRAAKGRMTPQQMLNLRPGAPGYLGAGPVSQRELQHVGS